MYKHDAHYIYTLSHYQITIILTITSSTLMRMNKWFSQIYTDTKKEQKKIRRASWETRKKADT